MDIFKIHDDIRFCRQALQPAVASWHQNGENPPGEGQVRAGHPNVAAVNAFAGLFCVIELIGKNVNSGCRPCSRIRSDACGFGSNQFRVNNRMDAIRDEEGGVGLLKNESLAFEGKRAIRCSQVE